MLKYFLSPINVILTYFFKESKTNKVEPLKNKPIKYSYVEKKITSNLLKNNKTLVSSTPI